MEPLTEAEIAALRKQYTPKPIPPCRICGEELKCGKIGGGQAIYHCGSEAANALKHRWGSPEEEVSRRHWWGSEVVTTSYDWGDVSVLRALDELEELRQMRKD